MQNSSVIAIMADMIGKDGIHHVAGICELCGDPCHPGVEELNALTCTFAHCNASIYHQDCLEKYLKRAGCEKNRKTGFPCPRGRSKAKAIDPCPGRIDKSHPIHPRSEDKRKKTKPIQPPVMEKKFGPAAKEAKRKEKEKEVRERQKVLSSQRLDDESRKQTRPQKPPLPATRSTKQLKNGVIDPKKQATTIEALRRELVGQPVVKEVQKSLPTQLYTLEDYEARKQSAPTPAFRPAQPTSNAWNCKPAPANTENEKPDLTSSAFPTIPGSKVSPAKVVAAMIPPRSWKASLAAAPPEPCQEPSLTTLASPFPRQPPPPPPPPRADSQSLSQETSYSSAPSQSGTQASFLGSANRTTNGHGSPQSSLNSSVSTSCAVPGNVLHPSMLFDGTATDAAPDTEPSHTLGAEHLQQAGQLKQPIALHANGMRSTAPGQLQSRSQELATQQRSAAAQQDWESDGDSGTELLRRCMTELAKFKTLCCLHRLSCTGLDHWLCLAAMQQVGVDGDRAGEWALDQSETSKSWCEEVYAFQGPSMHIDITQEMEAIDQVQRLLPAGLDERDIHQAIVHSKGDLHAALIRIVDSCQRTNGQREIGHVGTTSAEAVLTGLY